MATTLSTKGQVTIPNEIRKTLRIHPGDMVDFVLEKGEVKLKAIKKERAKTLAGSLRKYAVTGCNNDEVRSETKRKVAIDTAKEGMSG